ncbi:MAG: hypothetical protein PCFJNLEI_03773 [Verrucomicrobiae bacterium]|nr:hypothetical protein [Verrucomicrobiae bacterium]
MRRFLLLLIALTGPLSAAQPWQTLTNCKLVRHPGNDGDSFHVHHAGKAYIFRLYYVDTPETATDFPDRVAEQAHYFGISQRRAVDIGRAAERFSSRQLAEPFTVVTRWQDARGRSKLPRHYAFVFVNGRQDLGHLLVQNGLARVFGEKAIPPTGGTTKAVEQKLLTLERQARKARLGAWASASAN